MRPEPANGGPAISGIVPTIGRPASLARLLQSLVEQTIRPFEVIVADGSEGTAIRDMVLASRWAEAGLSVRWLAVAPPNAVRQRQAAIAVASGDFMLMLDDDVELEPDCVEQLLLPLQAAPGAVAAMSDISNQSWSTPTKPWRWYLRFCHGMSAGDWQGKVLGPLLRFGFHPVPADVTQVEWIGSGNSLIRRSAYNAVGGFSNFFLHRATINEDVDLAIKLSRVGRLLLCPKARMAHHHDPSGRMSAFQVAEDDVYNRFSVIHRTIGLGFWRSLRSVSLYATIESLSNVIAMTKPGNFRASLHRIAGRLSGLVKVARGALAS